MHIRCIYIRVVLELGRNIISLSIDSSRTNSVLGIRVECSSNDSYENNIIRSLAFRPTRSI